MENLYFFINERMKVLLELEKHQIEIAGTKICPINQQEISDLVECSKVKVNQVIKELIKQGYVEAYHTRGRYVLTEKANKVIKIMCSK
jgi:predicted transcriptional regulator